MLKRLKISSLGCFTASACLLTATAQTNPSTPTFLQQIKQPVSWMNWGGDLRVRNEYFNNLLTLNPNKPLHEQDYFRFRARVWTSLTPMEDLSLNARLSTEPRQWMKPAGYSPYKGRTGLDWTEGLIDGLNVQWKNILQQPATLTLGRQDLFLGDGWLVGPTDGEIPKILQDEECGEAFAPGEAARLAETLVHWSATPARQKQAQAARTAYEKHFTFATAIARWERILRQAAAKE